MKKVLFATVLAAVLVAGGSAAIYAKYGNSSANTPTQEIRISKADYERMSKIIIGVNKGLLPVSSLKEAQPLLEKNPELLSKKISELIK